MSANKRVEAWVKTYLADAIVRRTAFGIGTAQFFCVDSERNPEVRCVVANWLKRDVSVSDVESLLHWADHTGYGKAVALVDEDTGLDDEQKKYLVSNGVEVVMEDKCPSFF